MTAVVIVLAGIFGIIGTALITLAIADWWVDRTLRQSDELELWRKKVDAMRRLQDEEGAA